MGYANEDIADFIYGHGFIADNVMKAFRAYCFTRDDARWGNNSGYALWNNCAF